MISMNDLKLMDNKDRWDARYVDSGSVLYTCPVCHANVDNMDKHKKWHIDNFPRTQEADAYLRNKVYS